MVTINKPIRNRKGKLRETGGSSWEAVYDLNSMSKRNTKVPKQDILLARLHVLKRYRRGEFNKAWALILVNMLGVEKEVEHMPGKPTRGRHEFAHRKPK